MLNDHSIFAWDTGGRIRLSGSALAKDPSFFRHCHDIAKFINHLERGEDEDRSDSIEELNFAVTNEGIQIRLSIIPSHGPPSVYRAFLECDKRRIPISIDLASYKSTFYRYFGATGILWSIPEFQQIYLAYRKATHGFTFKLDARTIPYCGFSFCGIFPPEKASLQSPLEYK